jgi:uracil-DNA glycosylase
VEEKGAGSYSAGEYDVALSIRGKLHADLDALSSAITACSRCPGGGGGIPGDGDAGAALFLLAGRPGPGAAAGNPWGSWRKELLDKVSREWAWEPDGVYFSTALRCPLRKVTRREIRRCAPFLADEFFTVGPRLVVVSGKVATVALREALGEGIPGNPRAGDTCELFSTRFLFDLDIARIGERDDVARTFWHILRQAEGLDAGLDARHG